MDTEVLSTLQHVTKRKLEKLDSQRRSYEDRKASKLQKVATEQQADRKVEVLVKDFDKLGIPASSAIRTSLENIKRFLYQSRHDPSVSNALLEEWQSDLQAELDIHSRKYEYASLLGRLVTEWIERTKDGGPSSRPRASSQGSDDCSSSASFEQIGREEMHQQRREWESYAFNEKQPDKVAIKTYLENLFGSSSKLKKVTKTPYQLMRDKFQKFGKKELGRIDVAALKTCIKGVLREDLFTGEKRAVLVDLQSRTPVLKEMADVLNMDLESLDSWKWEPSPIPMHIRRQVNGKYRFFMDEEIHQALLLHYVGAKFSTHLKEVFEFFYNSDAWQKSPQRSMNKAERERRDYYLGVKSSASRDLSVRKIRRDEYEDKYFMTQLPSTFEDAPCDYAADNDDKTWASSSFGDDRARALTPLAVKQSLLHLATTELLLHTKLYGQFTILQSDFKWFGPSLPHATILTVLKFLGFENKWLELFGRFLETPLVFAQDGRDAELHTRASGIPMSHVLSSALGEAVLFCLDFAVNRRTKGGVLYRFHDDLWLWGQENVCVDGWRAIQEFADVMGLHLNEEKTGSVQITDAASEEKKSLSTSLPKGVVRWGFLQLDAASARWVIDKAQVDEHIRELRRQLSACDSVLGWIHAWNSYVSRFFGVHFGQAANCMGGQHVDMVIETLGYVQRKIFEGENKKEEDEKKEKNVTIRADTVAEHLRQMIRDRFGVENVPDGFLYFPVELGGLDLRNPLVQLFAMREEFLRSPTDSLGNSLEDEEKVLRSPREQVDSAFEKEEIDYHAAKKRFHDGDHSVSYALRVGRVAENDDEFMSLEEYTRFREETSMPLRDAYLALMNVPPEKHVKSSARVDRALQSLVVDNAVTPGFKSSWELMQPYWKWIVELHGGPIIDQFGGLRLGEEAFLPIGLLGVLRSEKARWQGLNGWRCRVVAVPAAAPESESESKSAAPSESAASAAAAVSAAAAAALTTLASPPSALPVPSAPPPALAAAPAGNRLDNSQTTSRLPLRL